MNLIEKEVILATIEELAGDKKEDLIKLLSKVIDVKDADDNYVIVDKTGDDLIVYIAKKETTDIKIDQDTVKTKDLSIVLEIYNELKTT